MAFNFNPPKTISEFTLPTSAAPITAPATGFQFGAGVGAGDVQTATPGKPPVVSFGAPGFGGFSAGNAQTTTSTSTTGLSSAPTPGFLFGATTTTTAPSTGFTLGTSATSAPLQFNLGSTTTPTTTTTASVASTIPTFSFGPASTTPSTTSLSFGLGTTTATTSAAPGFSLGGTATATTATTTTTVSFGLGTTTTTVATSTPAISLGTAITTSALSTATTDAARVLTFAQLEDSINKWTIDLEELGKVFGNQAKQLSTWDRLLIANGEKILTLNGGIERVKQQQQQLDHELDFVLSQQKELEDCIAPLEKELENIHVVDSERNQTFHLAESLDTQLKQISEDLKEIIEHINESNKTQELSDPITQIAKILNAHMNSLQWIDRNTAQISAQLDQITKMHDLNRRNHEFNLQRTYE